MIEITKACIAAFMKAKNYLVISCREKKKKYQKDGENVFSKDLKKNILLTSKSCLWLTFYQTDFMK